MHELLDFLNDSYTIKAFGLSLFHSMWQGAVMAMLLWLLLRTAGNGSASTRYWFALSALCGLLFCFMATFYLQLAQLSAAKTNAVVTDYTVTLVSESSHTAIAGKSILEKVEARWNLLTFWLHEHVVYFFLAWSMGFLLFSLRFFIGLHYLRRLKQDSMALPASWNNRISLLKAKLGLHQEVRLIASDKLSTPLTFGWLRPVIVFPLSMLSLLPEDQVETILLHELAHIRRHDYLINLLQSIIETTFFFNPGYWYISKVLENQREYICDDVVVAHGASAQTYARALTSLAEMSSLDSHRLALQIARQENSLLFRIKRIIYPSTSSIMEASVKRKSYQLASLLIACSLLFFLALDGIGRSGRKESNMSSAALLQKAESLKEITGTVLHKHGGAGIAGAVVRIKNTSKGTITDPEGNFKINATASDTLRFSFMGFHSKEVPVSQQKYLVVILESEEQVEEKGLVLDDIQVKESPEQPQITFSVGKSADAAANARIFLIAEEESLKPFYEYVSGAAQKSPLPGNAKELTQAELEAMDQSVIKNRLTISSETADSKRSVTVVRLKAAGSQPEEASAIDAKAKPLFILMKEDVLGERELTAIDYRTAFDQGSQISNISEIKPAEISAMYVLKGDKATAVLGEAGKRGVVFLSLKAPQQKQTSEKASRELPVTTLPEKEKTGDDFNVFPNPSNNHIKVTFNNAARQAVKVYIFDPNGVRIHTLVNEVLDQGAYQYEWHAVDRPKGIYSVVVQKGSSVKTKKLLIQ